MNLYQMVTGGLAEIKAELKSERSFREQLAQKVDTINQNVTALQQRVSNMEGTLEKPVVIKCMVALVVCLAATMLALSFGKGPFRRVKEKEVTPRDVAPPTVTLNYTFSLQSNLIDEILQKVTTVSWEQDRHFTLWDTAWHINVVISKSPKDETLSFTLTPKPYGPLAVSVCDIKVETLDKYGLVIPENNKFLPVLTNATCYKGERAQKPRLTSDTFEWLFRVRHLKDLGYLDHFISIQVHIRQGRYSKSYIQTLCKHYHG